MKIGKAKNLIALVSIAFLVPAFAYGGDVIGIYCWQLSPYEDVVCFELETRGGPGFSINLSGYDVVTDTYRIPVHGCATWDYQASAYILTWTWGTNQIDPKFLVFAADFDPMHESGGWSDSSGDSGEFIFLGAGPMSADFEAEGVGPKGKK